jgi:hypothetical protein
MKFSMPVAAVATLLVALLATAEPSMSQGVQSGAYRPALHHPRPRIEIHPRPLLYRRCVDWYELQHRPSGTVLFPEMRCWWVRG